MFYMKRTPKGLYVVKEHQSEVIQKGLRQYINELMMNEFVTLDGRISALKKKFGLKNNVPMYIHQSCCLYTTKPLRDFNTICINYCNVLSVRETKTHQAEIIFKNLTILKLDIPYSTVMRKHIHAGRFLNRIS